jgi:hypothetical protein
MIEEAMSGVLELTSRETRLYELKNGFGGPAFLIVAPEQRCVLVFDPVDGPPGQNALDREIQFHEEHAARLRRAKEMLTTKEAGR